MKTKNEPKKDVKKPHQDRYIYDGYIVDESPPKDSFNPRPSQTEIIQPTEMGEVVKELNSDIVDPVTKMSSIDMKSRLHNIEVSQITAVDFLVSVGFLPVNTLSLTRSLKRLRVSEEGKGRQDVVNIVSGKTQADIQKATLQTKVKEVV